MFNSFIVPVQNKIAALVNFFANAWNDPIGAVKVLFYDLALTVIGYIQKMASAIETLINKIPGVKIDITSGLDNFYSGLEAAQRKVKDQSGWIEVMGKMDYWAYEDAAKAGYAMGQGIEDKVSGMFNFDGTDGGAGAWDDIYDKVDDIAGNTADTADAFDITGEDLSYLRDIAERQAINRFTTRDITIIQNNENHIGSDMDLDGVLDRFSNDLTEELDVSGEGVHE